VDPGAAEGRPAPGITGLLNPDDKVLDQPAGSGTEALAAFVERAGAAGRRRPVATTE